MSAVELGRQTASRLHREAVGAGAIAFNPLEVVAKVAVALEVYLEDLEADAPQLQSAQALYDPGSRTIFYPRGAEPFWAAFLIGHELGHVCLGDDQVEDLAQDVDPARSGEAAPVGEDKVVDYSRHSRREVQMDLFSRELLLPRPWVRQLHLGEGLSASDIAAKLGAPFDVVAQQLFDALLLPEIVLSTRAPDDKPLNPAQKRAAEHGEGPFALEAGPGTGKTQTLASRVGVLLDRGVDPRTILILTFSNKAAGELAERIAIQSPEAAVSAWVGTFHGFGWDLLKTYFDRLGFDRVPSLMDRTEAIELLEAEVSRLGLSHYRDLWDPTDNLRAILNAVSRAQDEVAGPERYAECAEGMKATDPEAAEKALEVAAVYRRYQEIKQERQAVDFGDLVTLPVRLLREHPDVRQALQARYQHILVDEYQDVNRSSVALLELLLGPQRNLWVVGDARQAIYRFRGASSFNMARFGAPDFAPAKRDRLEVNYRSRKEIVDAFGDFGVAMKAGAGSDGRLEAFRGRCGTGPVHHTVGTKDEEGAGAAAAIEAARGEGYAYRQQAVLCKGNDRLARIGEDLERRGIPVLFLGSLFERPEIKDLLSWLTLLVDGRAMGLVRRRVPLALNLELADAHIVVSNLRAVDAKPLAWKHEAFEKLSPEGRAGLDRIASALEGFGPDAQPWAVLTRLLLDRTRVAADLASNDTVAARAQSAAIWQFMNFLRVQPAGQGFPIRRLLDRIRRLVRLADDRELRQLPEAAQSIDAVRLMTIHGSKGLQFDVVHVLGLNQQSLPRTGGPPPPCPPPDGLIVGATEAGSAFVKASDAEEQECLFYVALSRARDRLTIHSVRRNAAGASRPASSFLVRIGGLTRTDLDLSSSVLPDEDGRPLAVDLGQPIAMTLEHLESYGRCPRRFLYTHVLQIGGRRAETPFTDMHTVVQATVARLCAGDCGEADIVFAEVWAQSRVADHVYADDYRLMGLGLVQAFVSSRGAAVLAEAVELRHASTAAVIHVRPDEVLDASGTQIARRVRTGKRPSKERRLGEEAFALAALALGSVTAAEVVYLADGAEPARLEFKDAAARKKKADQVAALLAGLSAGRFPMKESERSCPSCPAFFVCGPVVSGALEKKLEGPFPVSAG